MSELYSKLKNEKLELLKKKKLTQEALNRNALPGYITSKNIRGKETYYLQFRDEFSKVTSVHLSTEKLEFCQKAFEEKARLEKELKEIDDDLHLLSLVDIDSDAETSIPQDAQPQRLLESAIGLSPKYKYIFYLTPNENSGDYEIRFFAKKEIISVPMVFVNEYATDRIGEYLISASCIVDEAADQISIGKGTTKNKLPSSGKHHTKSGIPFEYHPECDKYRLSFSYKKEKHSIEYVPYNPETKEIDQIELARMGFSIEQYIRMNAFASEVRKYYERKQNVHSQTQES